MTLYGLTLLLVVFGSLMIVLDAILLGATSTLLPRLRAVPPKRRATAILITRFLPVGVALVVTLFVFLPAWWRHEPQDTGEVASPALAALALIALLPLMQGLYRAFRMFFRTRERILFWRHRGQNRPKGSAPFELVEVRSEDLALCVGGYLRPTIYASAQVMHSLDPEELSAAIAHEASHASARDPLRLLSMGSCPDFLRLLGLDADWRRAFTTACEFAADEDASRGNPGVALDLASALVKVARLQQFRPLQGAAMADVAVSSAFSSRTDLEARIRALSSPAPEDREATFLVRPWMCLLGALVVSAAGALASERVHAVTEGLGRILAP